MLSTQNNEKASAYQQVGKQVESIHTNEELGKIFLGAESGNIEVKDSLKIEEIYNR